MTPAVFWWKVCWRAWPNTTRRNCPKRSAGVWTSMPRSASSNGSNPGLGYRVDEERRFHVDPEGLRSSGRFLNNMPAERL